MTLEDIEIATPLTSQSTESAIGWCALADDLAAKERLYDAIDLCLQRFNSMTKEDCTTQTLTLLSRLSRERRAVSEALVIKSKPDSTNVTVPFISQALNARFADGEAKSKFTDAVMAHFGRYFEGGEEFEVVAELSRNKKTIRLRCVPVTREAGPEARGDWVCFVVREFF